MAISSAGRSGTSASVGELVSNGIFGFLLGFKGWYIVQHLSEFLENSADVLLSPQGNWPIGIGMAAIMVNGQLLPPDSGAVLAFMPGTLVQCSTLCRT